MAETIFHKDPFIESISFPCHYLLTRLRNDREGDFYIGIDEYKLFLEAVTLQKENLSLDILKKLYCRLFAKSASQELRIIQHFEIVLQSHQEMLGSFSQNITGNEPTATAAGAANKEQSNTGPTGANAKTVTGTASARKQMIKKQLARINLPPVMESGKYEVSQKYVPANKREMSVFSRRLQKGITSSTLSDILDVQKTIESIARRGFFIAPEFASKKLKAKITILIDNGLSMIPFDKLVNDFTMATKSFVQVNPLYFKNSPSQQLYTDKVGVAAIGLNEWLGKLNKNSFIIILSDAGATRNAVNEQRIQQTEKWIRMIRQKTNRIIWLNPMPASRWMDTTAWQIRSMVNMYSFSRVNLEKAMEKIGL